MCGQEVLNWEAAISGLRLPDAGVATGLGVAGVDQCYGSRLHDEKLVAFGALDEALEQFGQRQVPA